MQRSTTSGSMSDAMELTAEQVAEFKRIFTLFDKDGDGTIVTAELGTVMRCLGLNPTEAEIKQYIQESDVNCDGTLEFDEEFLPLMARKCQDIDDEDELCATFLPFDRNNDGTIQVSEFKHLMKTMGQPMSEEDVTKMILESGADSDGKIDYREFIRKCLHS